MSLQDQMRNVEQVLTAGQALFELFKKIESAGMPPHTDFWHQSIDEAEKKLKVAVNVWLSQIP